MPHKNIPNCKFNHCCDRAPATATTAVIGAAAPAGCPFPSPVIERAWNKGEHLFHQGDRVKGAYSLRSGLVALERVSEAGEHAVLKLLQPGAFFPCADLFSDGMHGNSARAMTEVAACFIPADRLGAVLAQNPRMGLEIARRGCEEARDNEEIIFRLCSGDLAERVLAVIESLAGEAGEEVPEGLSFAMPIAWRDLASMLGTSPEVISRLVRKLTEAGRITVTGRQVTVPEPRKRAAG
ncbi:MAG: Crp/Fnr family transcriptional regulator [Pseudomonadota bacterium]